MDPASAYETVVAEVDELLPDGAIVVDAHTHLGADEDGQSLDAPALLAFLDQLGPTARACTFPFHDPERAPAYRLPNDRVLQWAQESGGRLYPYCRLDPDDDPVARRSDAWRSGRAGSTPPAGSGVRIRHPAAESIWKVAGKRTSRS